MEYLVEILLMAAMAAGVTWYMQKKKREGQSGAEQLRAPQPQDVSDQTPQSQDMTAQALRVQAQPQDQSTPPPDSEELRRALKHLRVSGAVFGAALLLDLVMSLVAQVQLSLASIGVILVKAGLFWYGWNGEKDERTLKGAISAGKIGWIGFLVLGGFQGLTGIMLKISGPSSLQVMSPVILAGAAEMLLYALLARYYLRNARLAAAAKGMVLQ